MRLLGVGVLAVLVMAACGNDHEEQITWYQTVAPIVSEHCMSCHTDGGVAPFALTDYGSVREHAQDMVQQIESGSMPPFGVQGDLGCQPRYSWIDDPRLSGEQRWQLGEWIRREFPVGDEAPIPPPPSRNLQGVTTTLSPTESWTVAGDQDQFVCYLLDPGVTVDSWLTGMQVRPGVPEVVHHVIVAELPAGPDTDAAVAQVGIGKPYDCTATGAISNLGLYVWTPGEQPLEMRDGVAAPLLAGAKLGLQFHYHPHGITPPDITSVDLRVTTERPQLMFLAGLVGNATVAPQLLSGPDDTDGNVEFRVPAEATAHTEHMQFSFGSDLRLASVGPHMHLLGTKLEAKRINASGSLDECLVNSKWDFDWQRYYSFDLPPDELPTIHADEMLDLTCTYNNSYSNPFMSRWLNESSSLSLADVYEGELTVDEMCLLIVGGLSPVPADIKQLGKSVRELSVKLSPRSR